MTRPRTVHIRTPSWLFFLLLPLLCGASATSVHARLCAGSFLGCRTHRQQVRFCRLACRSNRTVCTTAFRSGRLRTSCRNDLVSGCVGQGGSCGHACGSTNPCPVNHQCADGQCIITPPDRCGGGVCPIGYPNCGPDGRCWTLPCAHLCGADNCCGGDYPSCGNDGLCRPGPGGGGDGGIPTNLPPGDYSVTVCLSGVVSLCQQVGTIPFGGVSQFQSALDTVINQWLAATAGLPDCTRSATTYSAFDGSAFTATFTATCTSSAGSVSETVTITVRLS